MKRALLGGAPFVCWISPAPAPREHTGPSARQPYMVAFLLVSMLCLSGCGLGHLWHVTVGQAKILAGKRPVEQVLQEDQLSEQEKQKIRLILDVRTFAIEQLGLYASASYTTFVQLDRPYVSYNLSAAPPDALTPYVWKYPLVGRMPYKGFFNKDAATHEQQRLEQAGYETYLRGVRAYSTLGYFNDPILSSMLGSDESFLINTIIHEMVHQTVWIKGSVSFNESLANFIGEHGTLAYLKQRHGEDSPAYQRAQDLRADALVFAAYMQALLARLTTLYQSPLSRAEKLQQRAEIFAEAEASYPTVFPRMKTTAYRHFFARQPLNNAVLLGFRVYHQDTSFFERLLAEHGGMLRQMIAYCQTLRPDHIPASFRTP